MSSLLILLAIAVAGLLGYILGRRNESPRYSLTVPEKPEASILPTEPAPAAKQNVVSPAVQEVDPTPAIPATPVAQPEPTAPAQTPATPQPEATPLWKKYPTPVAIKSVTHVRNSSGGSDISCRYSDLTGANTERFLMLLQHEGFALDSFWATELHDRYEDFDSYSFSTFDDALRERRWNDVYGAWKLSGTFGGAEVLVSECHPGDLDEGIIVRYAEADAALVEPLLAAIERVFIPDLFVMDGSTVVSYSGSRELVVLPSGYPNACHAIGDSAFEGNDDLVSVVIPPCVTSIGRSAFKNCRRLESVSLQQETKQVFSRGQKKLVSTLVDNPVDIGYYAFEGCKSLKRLDLHPGVKSLGNRALYGCSSLERVSLCDSITSVGTQAFQGCDLLKTAGPAGTDERYDIQLGFTTQIPGNLFQHLKGLRRIVVPNGVRRLGSESIYHCSNLEEIVLPNSLEVIADEAIGFCPKLRGLRIPAGAQIEGGLLRGCDSLANEDGFIIYNNVLYDYIGHRIHVVVPDGVTRIADHAFAHRPAPGINHGDIVSVTIPDSVESIGRSAFYRCNRLVDINVPSNATVAGCAFNGCTSLRKKSAESEAKRSQNATWSWEMEPLKLAVDNSDSSSASTRKVHSYQATFFGGPSGSQPGKLVLAPTNFMFTATTDKQGWPSVKGTYGSTANPFARNGQTLAIRTTDGEYRFELSPRDLDAIEFLGLQREESSRRIGGFSGSIADGCVHDSWPGVAHPFFERHAGPATNKAAVFNFIGWRFLTEPLPWNSHSIKVEHSRHKLRVTSRQGADEYVYNETPVAVDVSYSSETVGFFDDSEHSESASFSLVFVESPTDAEVSQAKDMSEVRGGESACYLRDPFGMKGIFKMSRSGSRV